MCIRDSTNGAANFFVLHRDPADMAETVSMAFLGMSIQCAKCHDHPLEKWTNDEFYGMANLFSRVRFKTAPEGGDGNQSIFTTTSGAMKNAFGGMLHEHRHWTHPVIHEALVDLLMIQKRIHRGLFAVMDGTFAGDGPGPRCMVPHVKNVILASSDQVAIDAVAAMDACYASSESGGWVAVKKVSR